MLWFFDGVLAMPQTGDGAKSIVCHRSGGELPLPLAGEGWGEGFASRETPSEERALTRAFGAISPASGRGSDRTRGEIKFDNWR
uniref:Uncharacterized protein n=1 Tax=Bradyrhizobium ottawaense TaxID=931866 RepID=A0A2U8P3Q6_9BRAD|nr:hypothetical protein CIT37_09175 [Bradyrhizobium ottawaense]